MQIQKLDDLRVIPVRKAVLDSRGAPIRHSNKDGNDITYSRNGIIGVDSDDADETQTLFDAKGNAIMHNSHKGGDNFYTRNLSGIEDQIGFVSKQAEAKEPVQVNRTYRLVDFQNIVDSVKAMWQNKGKVAAGVAAAVLLNAGDANAGIVPPDQPFRNPLSDVSDSTPVKSILAPENYGNLTGADGDVGQSEWYAVTDLGYVHVFNGRNESPVRSVFTGISDLSGIAFKRDGKFALSAGKNIYEGSLGSGWNTDDIISMTTSDLTDIDYALDSYFIATESDGIRKVVDGGSEKMDNANGADSYDALIFKPGIYTNNMGQFEGESFNLLNPDGSWSQDAADNELVDLHNYTTIRGVAYFGGDNPGMAIVQNPIIQHYDPQAYQDDIQSIPEPATIALLGLGGGIALLSGYRRKDSGLFVPKDMKE